MFQFNLWQLMALMSAVCVWLGIFAATRNSVILIAPASLFVPLFFVWRWRLAKQDHWKQLTVACWLTLANPIVLILGILAVNEKWSLAMRDMAFNFVCWQVLILAVVTVVLSFLLMLVVESYHYLFALVIGLANVILIVYLGQIARMLYY